MHVRSTLTVLVIAVQSLFAGVGAAVLRQSSLSQSPFPRPADPRLTDGKEPTPSPLSADSTIDGLLDCSIDIAGGVDVNVLNGSDCQGQRGDRR